jgi:general secretion pathway protein A
MYEQHFGLKKRPFRASATGTDVFVGPHIAATMAGIKKALSANDAIVAVSGPVGSGKTTLVARALESISDNRIIIRVARMRLDSEDVLELLLDELGVQDKPRGPIQKFAFFRRRLRELEENKTRVFVAIEDSVRLGADTLAEIEALTSAEAGESEGASVVLMGDDSLHTLLGEPQLVRIQQRIRQRFTVAPLCVAELRGYLRHCFRLAGGEFERTFEANAAQLLHHLSKGIPRIANNLVESAMTAAADQDANQVASALVARIAENEYGFSAAGFDLTPPVEPPTAEEEPVSEPVPELVVELVPEPVAEAIVEPVLKPVPVPEPVPEQVFAATQPAEPLPEPSIKEPVIVFAEEKTEEATAEIEIPELIQDTLPDLQILAPEFAAPPEPVLQAAPENTIDPLPEPEPNPEPVLEVPPEPKLEVESTGNDVPDWDRDPTMAELKPDLAALEQAMAFAQGDDPDPAAGDAGPLPVPEPEIPEVIPEITLDHAISQRIESNLIDEPGEVSLPAPEKDAPAMKNAPDTPVVKLPQKQNKKADAELERIAVELAKAKSIEDIDDKLAETLFGEELNLIASHILANPPSAEPANDDIGAIAVNSAVNSTVNPQGTIPEPVAEGPQVGHQSSDVDFEVTLAAPVKLDDSGMDLSASQRFKTVRALNADLHPSIREPETTLEERSPPSSAPESIEDQINTSLTQTLKALNVVPPVIDDDMDDEEAKGGFFSRFKRS